MKKIIILLMMIICFKANAQCSISDQTVTATQTTFCPSGGSTTVVTGSSEIGLNYYLRDDADNSVIFGPVAGTGASISFNTGTLTITTTFNVYAEDAITPGCNLQMTNIVTVNIEDIIDPVANLAILPDITASCSITISTKPTATDNCAGTVTATTADPLTYNAQGSYIINWEYDDGNGNTSNQTQKVIIEDTTAPVPVIVTLADITGECTATAIAPTATDNCAGIIAGVTVDPLTYDSEGSYVIHWEYDDGNGNMSTQTQNVIIDDITAPVKDLSTLADVTGICSVTVASTPTATDNCAGSITGITSDALIYNTVGTHMITWNFDDGNGNISTQTQKIIVSAVDTSLLLTGATFTANTTTGATYEWVDCNSNTIILGETAQSFTASTPGSYALQITENGCTDKSVCYSILSTGIAKSVVKSNVVIYPNPSAGVLTIGLQRIVAGNIIVRDVLGQIVFSKEIQAPQMELDLSNYADGMFFVNIETASSTQVLKLMKIK